MQILVSMSSMKLSGFTSFSDAVILGDSHALQLISFTWGFVCLSFSG